MRQEGTMQPRHGFNVHAVLGARNAEPMLHPSYMRTEGTISDVHGPTLPSAVAWYLAEQFGEHEIDGGPLRQTVARLAVVLAPNFFFPCEEFLPSSPRRGWLELPIFNRRLTAEEVADQVAHPPQGCLTLLQSRRILTLDSFKILGRKMNFDLKLRNREPLQTPIN
jgi:hypothetical protein